MGQVKPYVMVGPSYADFCLPNLEAGKHRTAGSFRFIPCFYSYFQGRLIVVLVFLLLCLFHFFEGQVLGQVKPYVVVGPSFADFCSSNLEAGNNRTAGLLGVVYSLINPPSNLNH